MTFYYINVRFGFRNSFLLYIFFNREQSIFLDAKQFTTDQVQGCLGGY